MDEAGMLSSTSPRERMREIRNLLIQNPTSLESSRGVTHLGDTERTTIPRNLIRRRF